MKPAGVSSWEVGTLSSHDSSRSASELAFFMVPHVLEVLLQHSELPLKYLPTTVQKCANNLE